MGARALAAAALAIAALAAVAPAAGAAVGRRPLHARERLLRAALRADRPVRRSRPGTPSRSIPSTRPPPPPPAPPRRSGCRRPISAATSSTAPTPDFLARNGLLNNVAPQPQPSDDADWTVTEDGGAFRIVNEFAGRDLAGRAVDATGSDHRAPRAPAAPPASSPSSTTTGCADYPEIEVNVTGSSGHAARRTPRCRGFVETHMHQMAFEFLGHQGALRPALAPLRRALRAEGLRRPRSRTGGCGAVLETVLSGTTCHERAAGRTSPAGRTHQQLTHEQSYYKWLERSWRGGLRVFVNLLVENRVLCELYPITPVGHSCNEMDTVRRRGAAHARARALHRRAERRPRQGLVPHRRRPGRGAPGDQRRQARGGHGHGGLRALRLPPDAARRRPDLHRAAGRRTGSTSSTTSACASSSWSTSSTTASPASPATAARTGTITNGGNFLSAGRFWDLGALRRARSTTTTRPPPWSTTTTS